MVIHIDQIRDSGYRVDEPISREQLDGMLAGEGHDTGFRATEPGRLKAQLRKVSGGVLVDGSVDVKLRAPCRRCLLDVQLAVPVSFRLNLVPEELVRGEDEEGQEGAAERDEAGERGGTFSLDEADRDVFDGKNIDLDPILREQVLLAVPMNAVCREDCKGLCGQCGQNLNEAKCGCSKPVDPRLAALKNIKLN